MFKTDRFPQSSRKATICKPLTAASPRNSKDQSALTVAVTIIKIDHQSYITSKTSTHIIASPNKSHKTQINRSRELGRKTVNFQRSLLPITRVAFCHQAFQVLSVVAVNIGTLPWGWPRTDQRQVQMLTKMTSKISWEVEQEAKDIQRRKLGGTYSLQRATQATWPRIKSPTEIRTLTETMRAIVFQHWTSRLSKSRQSGSDWFNKFCNQETSMALIRKFKKRRQISAKVWWSIIRQKLWVACTHPAIQNFLVILNKP